MSRLLSMNNFRAIKLNTLITYPRRMKHNQHIIGKRDVVGYGCNGNPIYIDVTYWPFPAIRWCETDACFMALREKEKGDWKKLTIQEKKLLYRSSFCKTFAEIKAPTGEWKYILGVTLMMISFALATWATMHMIGHTPYPESLTNEGRRTAILKRMLELRVGAVHPGLSSKFDFDKQAWK